MGRPKLLLPLGGVTVIGRVLEALAHAEVDATYVLLRQDDRAMQAEMRGTGAHVVLTERPTTDMRASVELLLDVIRAERVPAAEDAWLLSPADHPLLSGAVLQQVLTAWRETQAGIVVPVFAGRRGHPTLFAWRYADQLAAIPVDRGLNWLLGEHAAEVHEAPVDDPDVLVDLDEPAEYERLRGRFAE